MLRPFLLLLLAVPAQAETRCGWYHNPTPGNVFLEDADGQWWISTQGNAPAPGFEDAYTPAFDDRLRIDYAGEITQRYGFSCACADGKFKNGEALLIARLTEIPLARCEADPKLPKVQLYSQ
jgi:Protein of unknown function (DUF4087)